MTVERTHYEVLNIERNSDTAAVRRAWKVLVQVWHPDRFSGDMRVEAERMTSRINEAYHTLRDPARKSAYDRVLQAKDQERERITREARRPARPPSWAREPGFAAHQPHAHSPNAIPAAAPLAPGDRAVEFIHEMYAVARRFPRLVGAVGIVWAVLFGSVVVSQFRNAPSYPGESLAAREQMLVARDASPELDIPPVSEVPADELGSTDFDEGVVPDDPPAGRTPQPPPPPPQPGPSGVVHSGDSAAAGAPSRSAGSAATPRARVIDPYNAGATTTPKTGQRVITIQPNPQ